MKQCETKNPQKIPKDFICELCHYYTSSKKDYIKHTQTQKHYKLQYETNETIKSQKIPKDYHCSCGNNFNSRTTLWRHKKKCINIAIDDLSNEEKQQQLVDYLLKENSEFKQMMLEQNKHMIEMAKNAGHNTTNNSNNSHNTTNNSFNLQFFLNETCKNAMNIMDFVSQLQVGNNDLEETGRLGFANGISKIFINGLKQINISDRPIHCSDFKRETVYIKNNNEWNKEDEDKKLLTNAIKCVAHKGIKQISEWTKVNPEFNNPESKVNDRYLNIVSESMSGSTEDETNKNYSKIIKNIVKETVIDK